MSIKSTINSIMGIVGLAVVNKRTLRKQNVSFDINPLYSKLYKKTKPYTMTTPERMFALYKATEYISHHSVPGDLVECGVYKGGSIMLCAYTLKHYNDTSRRLYLYDTFAGMDKPTEKDIRYVNEEKATELYKKRRLDSYTDWSYSPLEEVKTNVEQTGYPSERTVYVKGRVEDTIPQITPNQIALLRLDTDFYESTKHELKHLFPKLVQGGVLIIDDYGSWRGCRQAVDEYFEENDIHMLLTMCDPSCVIGVKTL